MDVAFLHGDIALLDAPISNDADVTQAGRDGVPLVQSHTHSLCLTHSVCLTRSLSHYHLYLLL